MRAILWRIFRRWLDAPILAMTRTRGKIHLWRADGATCELPDLPPDSAACRDDANWRDVRWKHAAPRN